MTKTNDATTGHVPATAWGDVDEKHKPSEVVQAIREEILMRLERQRGKVFGKPDEVLFLFDEIVTDVQRAMARGRVR